MTRPLESLNLKLGRSIGQDDGALDPVPRQIYRDMIGEMIEDQVVHYGTDIWNAYELGYFDSSGSPRVVTLRMQCPASSPAIVESKSFKLYLNQLTDRRFDAQDDLRREITQALSLCCGESVSIKLFRPGDADTCRPLPGVCLDDQSIEKAESPNVELLKTTRKYSEWTGYTHLFRSRCPVTAQPDWASVQIHWKAPNGLSPRCLLTYLVAFTNQPLFHEACCELIFNHLHQVLSPDRLDVACYFTRRGGVDINPVRSTHPLSQFTYHPRWRQ